jgi:hypothetical protein
MLKITDVNVLRYFIFNEGVKRKALQHIQPEYFTDSHCSEILVSIINHIRTHSKFPESLEIVITDNPWRQPAEVIREKLAIVKPENREDYKTGDVDVVLKQIEDWVKLAMFRIMLETGVKDFQKNSFESLSYMRTQTDIINSFSFTTQKWIDTDDLERMIQIHTLQVPRLACSWTEMNDVLKGGWKKKSINIIQGGTHSGKSRFMLSLASSFRRASPDNNVLYITLEIQDEDFGIYSDMHLMEMSSEKIQELIKRDVNAYKKIKMQLKNECGKIFIQEFPASQCNIGLIKSTLDQFLSRGHNISAVFLDYIGIMKSQIPGGNMYEKGADNVIALRSVSQEYGIPFFSAVQPDREGNRKNMKGGIGADMMNTSESKAIPDNSDFFANLIQSPEQYKANKQVLNIWKNRHSGRVLEMLLLDVRKDLYRVDVMSKFDFSEGECPVEAGEMIPPAPSFDM